MRKISRKSADRLLWATVVVAPFAIVQAARLLDVTSVASATADPIPTEESIPQTPVQALSPAQNKAVQWSMRQTFMSVRDPFFGTHQAHAEPDEPAPTQPVTIHESRPLLIPRFDLTSVIAGNNRALAAINRRVWRIGDEVEPGWTLTQLDARKRAAILESNDGRSVEILVADNSNPDSR